MWKASRRVIAACAMLTAVGALLLASGCGGVTNSSTNPTPSPTPTPSPAPAPNPTPSNAPDNYSAYLLSSVGRNNFILNAGTVKVDTAANNGAGVLQLQPNSGAPTAAAPFTLLFCPYPTTYQNIPFNYQNCITVATFTWDGQNSDSVNFTMPKGTWSGAFELIENGVQFVAGGMSTSSPGVGFHSALLPASSVAGGIGTATGPDTGSGSMSTNGTTLNVQIAGAMPDDTYNVQLCTLDGSCKGVGTLASDGSGNISGSLATGDWSIFIGEIALSDNAGVEFISAFRAAQ
jgi:hypothetical protein